MANNKNFPLLRDPYESEVNFFKENPNVAGMATEDERVIFNPYSKVHPEHSENIYKNEASRIFMKKSGFTPRFDLTPEQIELFKEYGDLDDIRQTIAARALSGDESSGKLTKDQIEFVNKLKKKMGY